MALYYDEAFTTGPRKHQLVKIDLTGFQEDGGQVLDVSTRTGCMDWITSDKGTKFAMKHQVVLLCGVVNAERVLGTFATQHMRPTRDTGKCSFDDFVHNLPPRIRSQLERFAGAAEVGLVNIPVAPQSPSVVPKRRIPLVPALPRSLEMLKRHLGPEHTNELCICSPEPITPVKLQIKHCKGFTTHGSDTVTNTE